MVELVPLHMVGGHEFEVLEFHSFVVDVSAGGGDNFDFGGSHWLAFYLDHLFLGVGLLLFFFRHGLALLVL